MLASGGLNEKTYLHCLESFEYQYNKGQIFFEFDIGMTNDGYFVAAHFQFGRSLNQLKEKYAGYTLS